MIRACPQGLSRPPPRTDALSSTGLRTSAHEGRDPRARRSGASRSRAGNPVQELLGAPDRGLRAQTRRAPHLVVEITDPRGRASRASLSAVRNLVVCPREPRAGAPPRSSRRASASVHGLLTPPDGASRTSSSRFATSSSRFATSSSRFATSSSSASNPHLEPLPPPRLVTLTHTCHDCDPGFSL